MATARTTRGSLPPREKDLLFGKPEVLAVIAANPQQPSLRAVLRTGRLWNQLCRNRARVHLDTSCLSCGGEFQRGHGAHHYETMVISALSVLELKDDILRANWKGFGDTTTKDFLELCNLLEHRLGRNQG